MTTTRKATEGLFNLAAHSPFLVAPKRAAELGEIMGDGDWELLPSRDEAQFYAVPQDHQIFLAPAGFASLWNLCFAAFHTMDAASRTAADPKQTAVQTVNLGQMWAQYRLRDHVEYGRRLFLADEEWPEGLAHPVHDAPCDSEDGRVINLFLGSLSWVILHEIAHVHYKHSRFIGRDFDPGRPHQGACGRVPAG